MKKYNKCTEALKEEIIQDTNKAGHMTVSIMFDRGSSNEKMKSEYHPGENLCRPHNPY